MSNSSVVNQSAQSIIPGIPNIPGNFVKFLDGNKDHSNGPYYQPNYSDSPWLGTNTARYYKPVQTLSKPEAERTSHVSMYSDNEQPQASSYSGAYDAYENNDRYPVVRDKPTKFHAIGYFMSMPHQSTGQQNQKILPSNSHQISVNNQYNTLPKVFFSIMHTLFQ